jgi:hypothetical protein
MQPQYYLDDNLNNVLLTDGIKTDALHRRQYTQIITMANYGWYGRPIIN